MPPWTMPNSAPRGSVSGSGVPSGGGGPAAGVQARCWVLQRAAQRADSSIDVRASIGVAGYGVHSSNCMMMSLPKPCWISIDFSGDRNTLSPLIGEAKWTPASVSLRSSARLQTWKPPESVRIGPLQFMKRCRPPRLRMISWPGRSQRWKVLPRMICAPAVRSSPGVIAFTVP